MSTDKKPSTVKAIRVILAALEGALREVRDIIVNGMDDEEEVEAELIDFPGEGPEDEAEQGEEV